MPQGVILKSLSGFYYVDSGAGAPETVCRARGRFRHEKLTPLVGDVVRFSANGDGSGTLDEILPRRNEFFRPSVANIDQLIIIASAVNPITDPFLIDRLTAIAEHRGCEPVICLNKCDLNTADDLYAIYRKAGFITLRISAETGEGLDELNAVIRDRASCFTGNSGVGKSSILNALAPGIDLQVGEVSEKLGRGRHTTRHVQLHRLPGGAIVADTPGFSSFDDGHADVSAKGDVQHLFREFAPYGGNCRYQDCAHIKEQNCAVRDAVAAGEIPPTRHASYVRLYEQAKQSERY